MRKYTKGFVLAFSLILVTSNLLYGNYAQARQQIVSVCHAPPGNQSNSRTIAIAEAALSAHLAHGDQIGSCSASFVVDVDANRTYGVIGTQFVLSAKLISSSTSDIDYQWSIGDGRSFSGETISITFDDNGFFPITLTATASTGDISIADVGVIIHDPNEQNPGFLGLPDQLGDVNNDGQVTLLDAHLAAKFVGRISALQNDQERDAAELDFEGGVTFDDVQLIASAVLAGAILPDQLLSTSGMPGSIVTLVSPALLNPEDLIEIVIGGDVAQIQSPTRPILGYVSFIIPFTGTAAIPGQKDIILLVNGNEARNYAFTVTTPDPVPEDPVAEVTNFFVEIQALLEINERLIGEQLSAVPITDEARSTLLAASTAGRIQVESIFAQLQTLLDGPEGTELAIAFYTATNANGLSEYRTRLQDYLSLFGTDVAAQMGSQELVTALAAISPDEVCDQLLPALCALKTAADLLDTGSTVVSAGCDIMLAAGIGAAFIPGGQSASAALLTGWATVCAPLEFTLDAAGIITDLVSDIDADLRLDASNSSPAADEVAVIKATLDVFGLDDICQIAGSAGASKLVDRLAEQLVGRLIKRKITVRVMTEIMTRLGGDILNEFLELLADAAGEVITSTGIADAILEFTQPYCEDIFGLELIMNASRVVTGPEPNEGILTFQSDGTAEYQCPSSPSSTQPLTVTFTAEKDICGTTQTKTVDVQCATRDVTITMGDNGSLNDDIFEVRLDGKTILTTNSPVRSVSVTVQLPVGSIAQVQMLGRAAPDGIGTYFINFTGATVISGDATSGNDLVPGTVKNFTIRVQP